jgi:hypothetical protein
MIEADKHSGQSTCSADCVSGMQYPFRTPAMTDRFLAIQSIALLGLPEMSAKNK